SASSEANSASVSSRSASSTSMTVRLTGRKRIGTSGVISGIGNIGDEHMTGCMGNGKRHTGRHHGRLRGDAAGPEDGDFDGLDAHRIAKIGFGEILDTDVLWRADMHGRSVHRRKTSGNRRRIGYARGGDRPHGYHHIAVQTP